MRHEPIELGVTGIARARRHGRNTAHGASDSMSVSSAATAVLDEAFAGFSGANACRTRVDGPRGFDDASAVEKQSRSTPIFGEWSVTKDALIKSITAQLESMDCQREQLAQLLRSVDADSVSR